MDRDKRSHWQGKRNVVRNEKWPLRDMHRELSMSLSIIASLQVS